MVPCATSPNWRPVPSESVPSRSCRLLGPTEKRNQGERDVPVQIEGEWVRPGDRLYADADGIVVIPAPA